MTTLEGLALGNDRRPRCAWGMSHPDYVAYHDEEWGRPQFDDRRLFEKLALESFQSGLSWLTILRKRENFRAAFADFDFDKVARFSESDVERLMGNAGIVRNRRKIESVIHNAGRAIALRSEMGSLAAYFWSFEPPRREGFLTWPQLCEFTTSDESKAMSRDLKRRGWRFLGPTTLYAFMQAAGLVNDHVDGCFAGPECEARATNAVRPIER